MGLFQPKKCVFCGNKPGVMTRTKLQDGGYVCFECSIKSVPKYMSRFFDPEATSQARYAAVKPYFDRSNELMNSFRETVSFGSLRLDENNGIFYVDEGFSALPLYLELRDLESAKFDFLPLDGHGSVLGASVRGIVHFKFKMKTAIGGECAIIENYYASASKQFLENNYTYTVPPEIEEFENRFRAAWHAALYG